MTKKSPVSILIGASSDAMDDRQKAILKDVAVAIGGVCTVAGVVIAALALRLTVVASHTDQRAWLGLFEADVAPQLAEGVQSVLRMKFINTGKTPALNVVTSGGWSVLHAEEPPDIEKAMLQVKACDHYGVVFPNGQEIFPTPVSFSKNHIDALATGAALLFVYTKIEYDDIFGARHRTKICLQLVPGGTTFTGCRGYNDAD